ncbi:peptidase S8/S53 domain-containing protein [Trichoderma barbatum]
MAYGLATPIASGLRVDIPDSHILHERHPPHWSRHWTKRNKLEASTLLPMRIGLRHTNLEDGHNLLMDISDPDSPNYGRHMTAEEIIDFFSPQQDSVDTVISWLVNSGISRDRIGQSYNKQWIHLDATTAEAEALLFAEYYFFEHSSGSHDISTEAYHLPKHIQSHVDYVTPGIRLRNNKKLSKGKSLKKRELLPSLPTVNSTTCHQYVTADCVRAQYGIPNNTLAASGNELGIYQIYQHYSKHDLDVYWSNVYPHIPNGTYPEERLINGAIGSIESRPDLPLTAGGEAHLDFDSSWPLIWPQRAVLFQEGNYASELSRDTIGIWNDMLDAIDGSYCNFTAYGYGNICPDPRCKSTAYPDPRPNGYNNSQQCGVYKPTNVISMSYEAGELFYPDAYMMRQCAEFMKLALQGTTVVVSSGDDGVGAAPYCEGPEETFFTGLHPSSCPYVLSVGGTEWQLPAGKSPQPWAVLNEVPAYSVYVTGGGFSNVFPMPSYQKDAVAAYFSKVQLPFKGYDERIIDGNYNVSRDGHYWRQGRAYPDVAAVGLRQLTYRAGSWVSAGGTSQSAPIFAAILTLLNELRIAAGKPTLGFPHPLFYKHPEAFNDITSGSIPGCNTTGFVATDGWDPVGGLGTPNFERLAKLVMQV